MGDDDEFRRLRAELEKLSQQVRTLTERLDDRDLDQAARDDALNRAVSGGEAVRGWSPQILEGGRWVTTAGGVHLAALVALTVTTAAATICEGLKVSLPHARRAEAEK